VARCWEYDYADRVIGEVASDGRVTRTVYDGLGRVVRVDENALGYDPARRTTEYRYDAQGRLSLIAAGNKYFAPGTAWETSGDALIRVTKMEYGAPVVTESYAAIRGASSTSAGVALTDPDKVWRIYLPDPTTGRPGTTASLEFSYLLTGEVAQRKDLRRGLALSFAYDSRGNTTSWSTDLSQGSTPPGGLAPDQVERVEYQYDVLDRLLYATAKTNLTASTEEILASTQFGYDGRGNLSEEVQQHGKQVEFDAPKVEYTRDFVGATSTSSGRDRLTAIQYPNRDLANGANPYVLAIGYGASGSIDDQLSRVASLGESGAARRLADFTADGSGQRVATYRGVLASSGAPSVQEQAWSDTFLTGGGVGADRLDRFGRVKAARADKVASGGALSIIWQTLTAYDAGGRRSYERVSTGTTTGTDNASSWLYGYDGLDRLTGAYRGRLNTGNTALDTTSARRLVDWRLDPLGSWLGDSSSGIAGRRTTVINSSGTTTATLEETDAVNGQEGITQRTRRVNAGTPAAVAFVSDATGNLQFDGRYVYQYDALGRLVQVSEKGSCTVNGSGQLTGTPGPWVEHRTYDGLGRLIRVQAPWPTTGTGYVVSRRFYYDGDRRIARVSTLPYSPEGVNLGDPGRIKGEIDLEKQDTWISSTDRLWVWDPSDTDRLVAVYGDSPDNAPPAPSSPLSRAWVTVTDLDGTPIAVLDHSTGSVVSRYEYDSTGNNAFGRDSYLEKYRARNRVCTPRMGSGCSPTRCKPRRNGGFRTGGLSEMAEYGVESAGLPLRVSGSSVDCGGCLSARWWCAACSHLFGVFFHGWT
jgi:YD repeat-containing protein